MRLEQVRRLALTATDAVTQDRMKKLRIRDLESQLGLPNSRGAASSK